MPLISVELMAQDTAQDDTCTWSIRPTQPMYVSATCMALDGGRTHSLVYSFNQLDKTQQTWDAKTRQEALLLQRNRATR